MHRPTLALASAALLLASTLVIAQPGGQPGGGGGQPPARGPGAGGGQPGGPGGGSERGGGRQPGGQGGGAQGGRAQSLEGAMKGLGRAMEALNASIADAGKKEENLRLLGEAQRSAVNAKNAKPTAAIDTAKDEAAKAAVLTAFRKTMIELVRTLIDAEVATLDGKTAEAKTALDKAFALEKKGHETFIPPQDKDGGKDANPMGR